MAPTTQKATTAIPFTFRFMLTTLEPLFTFGGIYLILTNPGFYLAGLTRNSLTTTHAPSDFIYTQLAGGWLYIAFTEMVVLRFVDDLRVWKLLCVGILLSDALYTHSIAQAVGGWSEYVKVWEWTAQDWMATIGTWPFVLARVAIVCGFGVRSGDKRD